MTGQAWDPTSQVTSGTITQPDLSLVEAPKRGLDEYTLERLRSFFTNINVLPDKDTYLFYSAKLAIITTGVAMRLPSWTLDNGISIKAASGNVGSIEVGGMIVTNDHTKTGNGFELKSGESISISIRDSSVIYINGTAGDFVSLVAN